MNILILKTINYSFIGFLLIGLFFSPSFANCELFFGENDDEIVSERKIQSKLFSLQLLAESTDRNKNEITLKLVPRNKPGFVSSGQSLRSIVLPTLQNSHSEPTLNFAFKYKNSRLEPTPEGYTRIYRGIDGAWVGWSENIFMSTTYWSTGPFVAMGYAGEFGFVYVFDVPNKALPWSRFERLSSGIEGDVRPLLTDGMQIHPEGESIWISKEEVVALVDCCFKGRFRAKAAETIRDRVYDLWENADADLISMGAAESTYSDLDFEVPIEVVFGNRYNHLSDPN